MIKEAQNWALKRLESEKLAEKLMRDSLYINSNIDKDNGTVARESVKTRNWNKTSPLGLIW